jgi:hypothetical protein
MDSFPLLIMKSSLPKRADTEELPIFDFQLANA